MHWEVRFTGFSGTTMIVVGSIERSARAKIHVFPGYQASRVGVRSMAWPVTTAEVKKLPASQIGERSGAAAR